MSPNFSSQIMSFLRGKDARTMHKVLRDFGPEGYELNDLTKREFIEVMRRLQKAHTKFLIKKMEEKNGT